MIAAIYARKSSRDDREGKDASVGRQVEQARAFAEARGWTVPENLVFVDNEVPAEDWDARRAWHALREAAESKRFARLVVMAQSRLSRDYTRGPAEIGAIEDSRVQIWAYETGQRIGFTDDDSATAMVTSVNILTNAEYKRAVGRSVRSALRAKAARGEATAGASFGYRNVRTGSGKGHAETVIEPSEAETVRLIFQYCAEGLGILRIAKRLTADSVPTAPPEMRRSKTSGWSKNAVREILYSERYRGRLVYNKTHRRKLSNGKATSEALPESDWIIAERPELRVVDEDLWQAAHVRLKQTRASYLAGRNGQLLGKPETGLATKRLLSGFLICGTCKGALMTDVRSVRGKLTPVYLCARRKTHGAEVCSNMWGLPVSLIEAAVIANLKETLTPERFEVVLTRVANGDPAQLERDRQSIKADVSRVEKEIGNLNRFVASGGDFPSTRDAIRDRQLELGDLTRELRKLEAVASTVANQTKIVEEFRTYFVDWRGVLDATPAAARQLLRKLITSPIAVFPHVEGESRCWVYTGYGAFDGLIHGVVGKLTYDLAERLGIADVAEQSTAECSTPARQLLGAAPVDQQRKMWPVLLDRAERNEHDGAGIAAEPCGAG